MTNQTLPCREAFEKWAHDAGYWLETAHSHGYEDAGTQLAWEGWQSAWNTRAQEAERTVKDSLTVATAPDGGEAVAMDDDALRAEWRAAGGAIHGPNVETVTMPEADYFRLRRRFYTRSSGMGGEVTDAMMDAATEAYDDFHTAEVLSNGCGADNHTEALREAVKAALHAQRGEVG